VFSILPGSIGRRTYICEGPENQGIDIVMILYSLGLVQLRWKVNLKRALLYRNDGDGLRIFPVGQSVVPGKALKEGGWAMAAIVSGVALVW